jgi:ABC-type uncharacterized transport system substrate-binding protein
MAMVSAQEPACARRLATVRTVVERNFPMRLPCNIRVASSSLCWSGRPRRRSSTARHGCSTTFKLALAVAGVMVCSLPTAGCRERGPREAAAAPTPRPTAVEPPASAVPPKKVLLVHSYHAEYEWVASVTRGVKSALMGRNVDLQIFYMDTKRHNDEAWKKRAGDEARKVVAEWRPDVVIASDDNAQAYFAKHYAGRPAPQIVFCGVNADASDYGYPASNITGVLERPNFTASLELFKKLVPQARRVAVVNDNSLTSTTTMAYFKQQPAPLEVVAWNMLDTFAEWQEAVRRAQTAADAIAVYNYHTIRKEGSTESMVPQELMSWTVAHSRIPIIGFITFAVDDGSLCGFLESAMEQGTLAGKIANQMLDGKTAQDIPMVTGVEGQTMVNLATARQLGIEIPESLLKTIDIVKGE